MSSLKIHINWGQRAEKVGCTSVWCFYFSLLRKEHEHILIFNFMMNLIVGLSGFRRSASATCAQILLKSSTNTTRTVPSGSSSTPVSTPSARRSSPSMWAMSASWALRSSSTLRSVRTIQNQWIKQTVLYFCFFLYFTFLHLQKKHLSCFVEHAQNNTILDTAWIKLTAFTI